MSNDFLFTDDDELEIVFDNDEAEIDLFGDDASSEVSVNLNDLEIDDSSEDSWKVLVVDDDVEVHMMTKVALRGFTYEDKGLTLISAYSGREACELVEYHPDVALILLDVVMEEKNSGLKVVKHIREVLNNNLVRIILRTGQPGEAPEESVILNYNINDYKTKTELTHSKLFTTMIATLRSYRDVMTIEANRLKLADQAIALKQEMIIRKQVEEALHESIESIRLITNAVPALISYVDSEQRYQFANRQYEEWFGLPPSQIKGMHIKDVEGRQTYEQMQESIEMALWGEEVTFETILMINGHNHHVKVTYVPHFDKDGQVLGFFSLTQGVMDIIAD